VNYAAGPLKICSDIIICHTGLDVFVLAPTGMGKVWLWLCKRSSHMFHYDLQSLCFQIPAVADNVCSQNYDLTGADFIAVRNHHHCFATIGSVERYH
jgi:hypothetical protein